VVDMGNDAEIANVLLVKHNVLISLSCNLAGGKLACLEKNGESGHKRQLFTQVIPAKAGIQVNELVVSIHSARALRMRCNNSS